jgi:hypothetical protein
MQVLLRFPGSRLREIRGQLQCLRFDKPSLFAAVLLIENDGQGAVGGHVLRGKSNRLALMFFGSL